jgi:N-acetylmuramoyl-L-alanine amidase
VNLAHKQPVPAKHPVPSPKEEESKGRPAVEEARSETSRKQVQVASKEEPRHNTSKPESEGKSVVTTAAAREAKPKSDGSLSLIRTLGLKIGRIVIDPGHGGYDNGTVGPSGLEEKELVLDVAFRLKKLVEEKLNGEVVMTRTDDTFIPLEERTAIANQSQADLFISIHANSSPNRRVSGVETFFLNFATSADVEETAARENASSQKTIFELQDLVQKIALKEKVDESREFAQTIQKAMTTQVQKARASAKDRGVKQAPFIVLIGANMPSILSEISFVSNPSDEKLLKSAGFRQKIAEALCHGIEDYTRNLSGVKTASNIGPVE